LAAAAEIGRCPIGLALLFWPWSAGPGGWRLAAAPLREAWRARVSAVIKPAALETAVDAAEAMGPGAVAGRAGGWRERPGRPPPSTDVTLEAPPPVTNGRRGCVKVCIYMYVYI